MSKGTIIILYFLVLFFLHQDFWWKNDSRLIFDILPVSLAYHVMWTLWVALGWFFVAKYCWPRGLDEEAAGQQGASKRPNGKGP